MCGEIRVQGVGVPIEFASSEHTDKQRHEQEGTLMLMTAYSLA